MKGRSSSRWPTPSGGPYRPFPPTRTASIAAPMRRWMPRRGSSFADSVTSTVPRRKGAAPTARQAQGAHRRETRAWANGRCAEAGTGRRGSERHHAAATCGAAGWRKAKALYRHLRRPTCVEAQCGIGSSASSSS
jgi:hypothetical protein